MKSIAAIGFLTVFGLAARGQLESSPAHAFNGIYTGKNTDRIAFPIGGMGAGMFCIEGTGAISHMSVRNRPDIFNEPVMFGAVVMTMAACGSSPANRVI
jgi:hypothetical protein